MKDDIVCTWPKTRTLESYLDELRKAEDASLTIGFRVGNRPPRILIGRRCYMVHSGMVRGWCRIVDVVYSDGFIDPHASGASGVAVSFGLGWYIVRDPHWHEVALVPMQGFRGWRYFRGP